MFKRIAVSLLVVYKYTVSGLFLSLLGYGCRYELSCSEFSIQAIQKHGVKKGFSLSIKRLLSCQPFASRERHDSLIDMNVN